MRSGLGPWNTAKKRQKYIPENDVVMMNSNMFRQLKDVISIILAHTQSKTEIRAAKSKKIIITAVPPNYFFKMI